MKASLNKDIKEYFWNKIKKITNNFSNLNVKNLGNGYIKCLWQISSLDNFKINMSKSCFYAIRLFDISNNRNKNHATCIMKEIQVSKFNSSISFPIPINKGVYYFEFGYRKRNGEWRLLASQELNLGYRIIKKIQRFNKDNWFDFPDKNININSGEHEAAYKASSIQKIGGSEKIAFN
tara:strand:- start:192 stop:725 length:534 start_codon:yes stop_codon:yes gene_type:complete